MVTNRSKPAGSLIPSLIYQDLGKAIDWLCGVFGFVERLRITGRDGVVGHAQLRIGQGGILLGQGRKDDSGIEFRPPRPNEVSVTLTVNVEDVDAHYERAKSRGARILMAPATHPYGERQYSALDLEGYRWAFTQAVSDVAPQDWGAVAKDLSTPYPPLTKPRFCYMEIPASDPHRSAAFYEAVFGWNIRHRDRVRPSFDDGGSLSGAFVIGRPPVREASLLPYIWVESVDRTLTAILANGGEIVEGRRLDEDPGGEWMAIFRVPAGNLMGLHQEGGE